MLRTEDVIVKNKHLVVIRSLLTAVALALIGAFLNELGIKLFPQYEKYVDNVVALIVIIPMIYFVFVPAFAALSHGQKNKPSGRS